MAQWLKALAAFTEDQKLQVNSNLASARLHAFMYIYIHVGNWLIYTKENLKKTNPTESNLGEVGVFILSGGNLS